MPSQCARLAIALVLALLAGACSSGGQASSPYADPVEAFNAAAVAPADVLDPEAEADLSERNLKANVNIAIADVALTEVIFDTFDGEAISLRDATDAQIGGLLNAIPPLTEPLYVPGTQASWLAASDLVLGFVADDGSAWAHPHQTLEKHPIVNTTLGERPIAVTYCAPCGSGRLYDRRPNDLRHDGLLTFGTTGARYLDDIVIVDEATHTYWSQATGAGIVGNLTGAELTLLPSRTTSWSVWLESHPATQVLDDQGN